MLGTCLASELAANRDTIGDAAVESGVLRLASDAAFRSMAGMASPHAVVLFTARGRDRGTMHGVYTGFGDLISSMYQVARAHKGVARDDLGFAQMHSPRCNYQSGREVASSENKFA